LLLQCEVQQTLSAIVAITAAENEVQYADVVDSC